MARVALAGGVGFPGASARVEASPGREARVGSAATGVSVERRRSTPAPVPPRSWPTPARLTDRCGRRPEQRSRTAARCRRGQPGQPRRRGGVEHRQPAVHRRPSHHGAGRADGDRHARGQGAAVRRTGRRPVRGQPPAGRAGASSRWRSISVPTPGAHKPSAGSTCRTTAAAPRCCSRPACSATSLVLDVFVESAGGEIALYAPQNRHPLGAWYHVAAVVDGQRARHYVNGVQEMDAPLAFRPHGSGRTSIGGAHHPHVLLQGRHPPGPVHAPRADAGPVPEAPGAVASSWHSTDGGSPYLPGAFGVGPILATCLQHLFRPASP